MLEFLKYEGKNYEETLEECLTENNLREEDLVIKTEEKENGIILYALDKLDVRDYIKSYLKKVSLYMGIDMELEVSLRNDVYSIIISTTNSSILIGKDGRTLDSLQLLIRQSLKNITGVSFRVVLDIAGYKQKQARNFEYEIKKIINEVLNTKMPVVLDPMNSYQRRIVHSLVGEYKTLSTFSTGEGKDRAVNIVYKDQD